MTKTSRTPPPGKLRCRCAEPEIDNLGRVLHLQTCPVCMKWVLDRIRGTEVALAYEKGESQVLIQQELFRFTRYSKSGQRKVIPDHGK